MRIELERNTTHNDYQTIRVDGEAWGHVYRKHHGIHGKSYTFHQKHGGQICWADGKLVKVRSVRKRSWSHKEETTETTPQRILSTIEQLIEAKLLRHPAIVKHEVEERVVRYTEAMAQIEAKKQDAFRAKAEEALGNATIEAVVEAMKWAQTQ